MEMVANVKPMLTCVLGGLRVDFSSSLRCNFRRRHLAFQSLPATSSRPAHDEVMWAVSPGFAEGEAGVVATCVFYPSRQHHRTGRLIQVVFSTVLIRSALQGHLAMVSASSHQDNSDL